jgi:hypothetical protein
MRGGHFRACMYIRDEIDASSVQGKHLLEIFKEYCKKIERPVEDDISFTDMLQVNLLY